MNETMTVEERMQAAIAVEPVDRHPVFPIMFTAAVRLYGRPRVKPGRITTWHGIALVRCYKEYGYDYGSKPNFYWPMLPGKHCGAPVRNLIPGKHLGEDDLAQIDERVLFEREDYDKIAALGWNGFWDEHYEKISRKTLEQFVAMQRMSNDLYSEDMKICEGQGMPIFLGVAVDSVMMSFSLCRTLMEFTRDLYEVPDKVEAAMRASCDDLIGNAIQVCKNNGKSARLHRPGAGFRVLLPPGDLRALRVALPAALRGRLRLGGDHALAALRHGLGLNLPYLKQLPRGSASVTWTERPTSSRPRRS